MKLVHIILGMAAVFIAIYVLNDETEDSSSSSQPQVVEMYEKKNVSKIMQYAKVFDKACELPERALLISRTISPPIPHRILSFSIVYIIETKYWQTVMAPLIVSRFKNLDVFVVVFNNSTKMALVNPKILAESPAPFTMKDVNELVFFTCNSEATQEGIKIHTNRLMNLLQGEELKKTLDR